MHWYIIWIYNLAGNMSGRMDVYAKHKNNK